MSIKEKQIKRKRRHRRVRAKIYGTKEVPRLCVFRSNKHIYAQLINDEKGKTLVIAKDLEIKNLKATKTEIAYKVGELIAEKAINLPAGRHGNKIKKIVFDRGGYKYHGRVKALAEGARKKGLEF